MEASKRYSLSGFLFHPHTELLFGLMEFGVVGKIVYAVRILHDPVELFLWPFPKGETVEVVKPEEEK